MTKTPDALADTPADVDVASEKLLAEGYHDLERFSVRLRTPSLRRTSDT